MELPEIEEIVNDILSSSGSETVSGSDGNITDIPEVENVEPVTVSGNESYYDPSAVIPEMATEIDTTQIVQLITEQNKIIHDGYVSICVMLGLIFGAIAMKGFWLARVKE